MNLHTKNTRSFCFQLKSLRRPGEKMGLLHVVLLVEVIAAVGAAPVGDAEVSGSSGGCNTILSFCS